MTIATIDKRWTDDLHRETVHRVLGVLTRSRFSIETEKRLQADMAEKFADAGLVVAREVVVTGGIIDFLVEDRLGAGIGIEVKIAGAAKDIYRQLQRYAEDPRIASFVLVTAKPIALPPLINGKRVTIVQLGRAWL